MREIVIPTFVLMPQPMPEALGQLAAADVRLIEVHGDAPDTHLDLTDQATVEALAKTVGELSLVVHAVHAPFSQPSEGAWDIAQPDDRERAHALRRLMGVITVSAALGARHVVLHIGVSNHGADRLARGRAGLAQLAESAAEAGVGIAVENMPRYGGASVAEVAALLDGLDPQAIGLCLDTGHAMMGQDRPEDYVRALGDRLWAVHWHASNDGDDAHLFPIASGVNWDPFVAALDEVGYTAPVTVEALPPETASLPEAIQAAHAIITGAPASRPA
jgi:sugar phosphate isomerase/epimerase